MRAAPAVPPPGTVRVLERVLPPGALGRARWHADERRLDWDDAVPPGLEGRVAGERERFDAIAALRRHDLAREPDGPWTHSPLLASSQVRDLLRRHPDAADVRGLTVLDVGGTAPVSWRFLQHGAAALHGVDVSPESQRVALERCALHGVADDRVVFHTTSAERLPFADGTFDLAFSRNCVHHLARPAAYDELARVLRPGGRLLIFEPWLNRAARAVVFGRRRALRIDRGTDDPLGRADLAALSARFSSVDVGRFGVGVTPLSWALRRARLPMRGLGALRALEDAVGAVPPLARALGTHAWVLATR